MNVGQVGEENVAGISRDLCVKVQQYRGTGISFGDLLKEKVVPQELKFSAHAENRIKSRGIEINKELKQKINDAVANVASKGGKDALIFTDNSAFIVNVKSKTVVTAIDKESFKENVFTNIDSAAII
jgi:flagellar operon protein